MATASVSSFTSSTPSKAQTERLLAALGVYKLLDTYATKISFTVMCYVNRCVADGQVQNIKKNRHVAVFSPGCRSALLALMFQAEILAKQLIQHLGLHVSDCTGKPLTMYRPSSQTVFAA